MPDTAPLTKIRHGTQSLQQPLRRHHRHRAEASEVANGRRNQRRYTSGHGDGSGDRYGCEEPLMITGRAVFALLLHHYRRVVVQRAVNYDFAGALPIDQRGPNAIPRQRTGKVYLEVVRDYALPRGRTRLKDMRAPIPEPHELS
jgi:hypothetical protein